MEVEDAQKVDYGDVFLRYILTLQAGAKIALGDMKDPTNHDKKADYGEAREIINILGMISQKTKGNLTEYEEEILNDVLSNLRIAYVKKISD